MEPVSYIRRHMPLWDGWELGGFLGSGSFGNVWLAVRGERGKREEAAIKEVVVPPAGAGTIESACLQGLDLENARAYFAGALEETIAEAKLQCALSDCRNIVAFRDYQVRELDGEDEFGWVCYILMEKAKAFSEYLMENGIDVSRLIRLGIDVCRALERCRAAGIVHRDVKPENIFYSPEKDCFLLGDFGMAHGLVRATESKGRPGTLTHMSPEVYRGEDFGYGDDVYALGMVLYKLLNFNRIPLLLVYPKPYMPKDRDEALMRRLKGAPLPLPALAEISPGQIPEVNRIRAGIRLTPQELPIVRHLAQIAQKAVSADQNQRYPDAAALREALEELIDRFM